MFSTIDTARDHLYVAIRKCDLVFLLPAKVASSSIKRTIRGALGLPVSLPPDRLDYVSRAEAATFTHRVGFVRDPMKRLESCWADKFLLRLNRAKVFVPDFPAMGFHQDMTFAEFAERVCEIPDERADCNGRHFRSLSYDLSQDGQLLPTMLCRFESLDSEWLKVRRFVRGIGGPKLQALPHLRKATHTGATWTAALKAKVAKHYEADFENFGYPIPC